MIDVRPFDPFAAMAVLSALDADDVLECEAARGAHVSHLTLFAEWVQFQPIAAASWCVYDREGPAGVPFALLLLCRTGAPGVVTAALLAKDHARWRLALFRLAKAIRAMLPDACRDLGLTRIEARAWARHPRAGRFLRIAGFAHEADLPGFGPDGCQFFRQYAYVPAAQPQPQPEETAHVLHQDAEDQRRQPDHRGL